MHFCTEQAQAFSTKYGLGASTIMVLYLEDIQAPSLILSQAIGWELE